MQGNRIEPPDPMALPADGFAAPGGGSNACGKDIVPEEAASASSKEAPRMQAAQAPKRAPAYALEFSLCFAGLQASFLTWGYVQEKVMTTQYATGRFPSAAFCVLSNRLLAVVVAAAVILWQHGRLTVPAPWVVFAPSSLSNSLSSLAQYQALRYVSFPLQTLSKSTRMIPVMLVGKLLNRRSYTALEYGEAIAISLGVSVFSFSEIPGGTQDSAGTRVLGLLLLALYIAADSFTSQWQSRVYTEHPTVDQFQMMFATNLWSLLLALVFLMGTGELWHTLVFLDANPSAARDNLAIAVSSATGQVFIFHTIRRFGPVTFTTIMTTRQMFSMIISAVAFGHALGPAAYTSAVVVFAVLLFQSWRRPGRK